LCQWTFFSLTSSKPFGLDKSKTTLFFFKLIASLPFGILYRLSDGLFLLAFYVIRYRRTVVDDNLRAAFPEKTSSERYQIARQYYRNLCDLIIELIKSLKVTQAELLQRMEVIAPEVFMEPFKRGEIGITVVSHTINWEWGPMLANIHGLQNSQVIYRPLSSAFFDQLMLAIRSRFGTTPIPEKQTFRYFVEGQQTPRLIGIAADVVPASIEGQYWTDFFGQKTVFYTGTEKLARKFNYRVFYTQIKRLGRGKYQMEMSILAQPPYDNLPPNSITEAYVRRLEADIKANPSNWLWSHRRWKHKYPAES
jgi:Kdo2-lipid IVA lauroyltransferase/acyltransferase